jgi:hypothetical protein
MAEKISNFEKLVEQVKEIQRQYGIEPYEEDDVFEEKDNEIKRLNDENKKLKSDISESDNWEERRRLSQENKRLKSDIEFLEEDLKDAERK